MIQFYAPDIEQTLTLPESDSQHCVRVLRMSDGDILEVVDGKGFKMTCRLTDAHPKHAVVEILGKEQIMQTWKGCLTVAVAPTKHLDRIEWMVEKMTEIGVNRIVPLLCRHSERKELKTDRLKKIAVSAMKQSLKATMPAIEEMTSLKQFVSTIHADKKFVAYCDKSIERHLLAKEIEPFADTVIMIGPEGDFAPEEIKTTLEHGFKAVSLGECRLRTETAAVASLQMIHSINQLYS